MQPKIAVKSGIKSCQISFCNLNNVLPQTMTTRVFTILYWMIIIELPNQISPGDELVKRHAYLSGKVFFTWRGNVVQVLWSKVTHTV